MDKLKARELRRTTPSEENYDKVKRNPIYLILDNVIDTYNIGSLFRLADAVAAEKIYICGSSEYPPSSRIHKAAVGTEAWVPWVKKDTTIEAINELQRKNVQIIAVEQSPHSTPISDLKPSFPCAIVVGHETDGVSKEVLKLADIIVELPMFGINHSFNVWGSAAVVAYKVLESITT